MGRVATVKRPVEPGQRWAVRDDRYEGWRYVTVLDVDSRYVYVQGPRKSRILVERFGGSKYTYCGHDGPGILPPYSTHILGCGNAPPPAEVLSMRYNLAPGFGRTTVTRDGEVVFQTYEFKSDAILARFERQARREPGDWRLRKYTPMHEVLYQRQGPDRWVLVAIGMGFA